MVHKIPSGYIIIRLAKMASMQEVDALVVGAGFGGLWMTNRYEFSLVSRRCISELIAL